MTRRSLPELLELYALHHREGCQKCRELSERVQTNQQSRRNAAEAPLIDVAEVGRCLKIAQLTETERYVIIAYYGAPWGERERTLRNCPPYREINIYKMVELISRKIRPIFRKHRLIS